VSDAISRKQAAEIFGLSVDAFDVHVRPHLTERRFGRRPRFSRAEVETLWEAGGVAARPAVGGAVKPPRAMAAHVRLTDPRERAMLDWLTKPPRVQRPAGDLAELAARLPLTARQRKALLE